MTYITQKISCIILAGGEGKRVDGRDKGLIDYQNKPLVQHVINAVLPQTHEIIISANRNVSSYENFGYKVISDATHGFHGPLAGIATTLPYCSNDLVLIVPCDMPHLPANIIQKLSASKLNNLRIVETEDRLQLVFLLHKKISPTIIKSLDNNERRLMRWAKAQNPDVIKFKDAHAFDNYNHSTDFIN